MSTVSEIVKMNTGRQTHQRKDHGSADARLKSQTVRVERESKENDTRKLIVEMAERLFRQIGFQKTTIADIARELRMSSANVYRFFLSRFEITEAVCMELLGKIAAEAEKIAASDATAAQRIRNLIALAEKIHLKRYTFDRKLHELIEAAITENWAVMHKHNQRMAGILEQVIASGMAAGEFHPGDAAVAARLVNTACVRFCHPRLIVEYEQEPELALDQMVDFCFAALVQRPV